MIGNNNNAKYKHQNNGSFVPPREMIGAMLNKIRLEKRDQANAFSQKLCSKLTKFKTNCSWCFFDGDGLKAKDFLLEDRIFFEDDIDSRTNNLKRQVYDNNEDFLKNKRKNELAVFKKINIVDKFCMIRIEFFEEAFILQLRGVSNARLIELYFDGIYFETITGSKDESYVTTGDKIMYKFCLKVESRIINIVEFKFLMNSNHELLFDYICVDGFCKVKSASDNKEMKKKNKPKLLE